MSGYSLSSKNPIDDQIQEPMRNRLRTLRMMRGQSISDITTCHAGTMTKFELHDISTMTIGQMFGIAQDLGVGFVEFTKYLFGEEEIDERDVSPNLRRMAMLIRSMSNEEQVCAVEMISSFSDYCLAKRASVIARVPARDILAHADASS